MQFVFGVSFGGPVPTYTTTGETAIRCIVNIPTAPANEFQLLAWYTTSTTLPAWELKVIPGSPDRLYLKAYNSSLVEQLGDTGMNLEDDGSGTSTSLYGRQLYIEVDLEESGGGVNWDYRAWHTHAFNSGVAAGGGVGTEGSSTVGRVYRVACTPHTTGGAGTTLGHIAVATDLTYGPGAAGCTGFAGESVSIRFSGLATELDVNGLSSGSNNVAMRTYVGASSATDIVSLYRELETAEQGVLYDGKTGFLELLLREDRYNNAVGLSLDRDSGELDWIRPTDDDQVLYNDVTVSRPRGSERRALDKASVAANGTYASRVDALLFNDDVLQDHANWRLHLGTVDELRYPQVSLNLAAVPSLLADWLACDIGSRIQVTNPPAGLPPDTIDLHVEGYTESLSAFEYRVDLNCSPASPWQVFELEDDTLGRLDTDGSALVLDYSNSATTFLIASTAAPTNSTAVKKWSTTAEPYDLWIAGERVTVTNMASNAVSFVAAGTAVHGDNASLNPSLPAGIQDGDLLLICSAIRNTAAFVDGVSGGWTNLSDTFSNFRISAKRYVSGVSAPTVTFAGGSAGDTTSSQICAFRNVQLNVIAGTTQSNSSAANIATPALTGVDRDALLIIWAGWKQDDWTSVTGPGTEIGEPSSTTGNDQAFTWAYQIQTTVSGPASNTFTVTGGASAISRAIVLALAGDVQTATVTRAVNGVAKTQASGAAVQLWKPGIGGLAL
jgi:hypothetical protein